MNEEKELLTLIEITNFNIQKIGLLCKVTTIIIVLLVFISNFPVFQINEQFSLPLFHFLSFLLINVVTLYFVCLRKVHVTKNSYKKVNFFIGLYVTLITTIGAFISYQDFQNYHQSMVYTLILLICCSFLVLSRIQVVFALIISSSVLVFGIIQQIENMDWYQQLVYVFTLTPIAYYISRSISRSYVRKLKFQVELMKKVQMNQELTKKLRIVNRKLELQATIDPLTNLFNRRAFNDYIDKLKLKKPPYTLTIMMIDVDDFKRYNDTYGHCKGDHVLEEIGKLLQELSEEYQFFVARWGGEEFSIVLLNQSADFVEFICKKVCEGVRNLKIPHIASSVLPFVSVSIGASSVHVTNMEEIDICLQYADQLLYVVKENGRNSYIHKKHKLPYHTISKVER